MKLSDLNGTAECESSAGFFIKFLGGVLAFTMNLR